MLSYSQTRVGKLLQVHLKPCPGQSKAQRVRVGVHGAGRLFGPRTEHGVSVP